MQKNILNNLGSLPVVFASGEGSVLTDIHGKTYIDFASGIGVNCLGHNHPALIAAITAQAAKQIHVSNYYTSDTGLKFAEALLAKTGTAQVFFGNSGAEANEAAIKIARKYGYLTGGEKRKVIVTLEKSFHGRTITTLAATGQEKFHTHFFSPYPEGFRYIKANDYAALESAFDEETCGFLFECVQGESGVNLVDPEWARAACSAARKAGALVITDEVQTGIGRTGTFLAAEQLGITPDVITLAKGIAGGIPMGAALVRDRAENVLAAGDHQSTFGGNPLACAGGLAVLEAVGDPAFLASVKEKGEYLRSTVTAWNLPSVREVRGRGLMIGIDIGGTKVPHGDAFAVQRTCLESGLCVSTAGPNTVRFLPPLVITKDEIDSGLAVFREVLSALD